MVHDGRGRGRGFGASSLSYGRGSNRGYSSSNGRGPSNGAIRGRGLVARNMTTVPLDYESHVNHKPDPVMPIYGSGVPSSSSGPSSRTRTPAPPTSTDRSYADSIPYAQSPFPQTVSRESGHADDDRPSFMPRAVHAGIGSAGRKMSATSDDNDGNALNGFASQSMPDHTLSKPALAFVKAKHGDLASTIDDGIISQSQTVATSRVTPPERSRSASPLPPLIRAISRPESPVPPLVRTGERRNSPPLPQLVKSHSPTISHNGSATVAAVLEQSPLYFVDVLGAQSSSIAPVRHDTDDDESDTEELYPRRVTQPAAPTASTSRATAVVPRQSVDTLYDGPSRSVRNIQEDVTPLLAGPDRRGSQATRAEQDFVQIAADVRPRTKKLTKKAKLQAKRDGRRSRKQASRRPADKSSREPRLDDSDVDWGSDDEHRPRGKAQADDDSEMSDVDDDPVDGSGQAPLSKLKRLTLANVPRGKKVSAIDLAVEDYLANIGQAATTDDEADQAETSGNLQADDIRRLRSFANAVSMGEHLTIDDLEDLADMQAEEDDSAGPVLVLSDDTDEESISDEPSALVDDEADDVKAMTKDPQSEASSSEEDDDDEPRDASRPGLIGDSEGDDDAILEDVLMSMTKARRPRNLPTFETDAFDDMLQAQWRKDRQKKAIKRQERALQRLEQKSSKANAKKAKRAVANSRGFFQNDRDDNETSGFDLRFSGGVVPPFHRINEDIRTWIDTTSFAEYPLPPMDKKFRCAIHMLATAYNLKSKSAGKGTSRHNVLYRTQHSSIDRADVRKVREYLTITSSWSQGNFKTRTQPRIASKQGPSGGGHVTKNAEGAVVGFGADRIASDNIGHQMLAKMGWAVGSQIGKTGGIHEPIAAIVKTSKAGLGSGWVRYNRGTATPLKSGTDSS